MLLINIKLYDIGIAATATSHNFQITDASM